MNAIAIDSIEMRANRWIVGRDTGASSRTLWATMMGVQGDCAQPHHPHDPGDLGRCLRLLDAVPEWKPRIGEMAAASPEWAALVGVWDSLSASYESEAGPIARSADVSVRAPETFRLIQSILAAARR